MTEFIMLTLCLSVLQNTKWSAIGHQTLFVQDNDKDKDFQLNCVLISLRIMRDKYTQTNSHK
jgi:hypothetical protein